MAQIKQNFVLIGVVTGVVLFTMILFSLTQRAWWGHQGPKTGENYDELEFIVIHRPDVTYFIDNRYILCFATRKPDYQDLVQFECPERMLREVEESLKGRLLPKAKPAPKDAK